MSSDESIIGKFFGILGFKVDHHGVEEFKASLEHTKHAVEGIFAVEVFERITEFVERSIGAAGAVNDLGEVVQMTATEIAALGRVAVENGSGIEAMNSAINSVFHSTGQAAMGLGRNVKLFQQLGIKAKDSSGHVKSVDTVMGELADKFQNMDMAKVVATAGRLGIDPIIAKTMKELGGEGWRKAVSEAMGKGLLSEEDYRQASKTETTFKRFHILTGQLATLIANQLAPWLRRATKAIEDFFAGNKEAMTKRLHKAMKTLSEVLSRVWDFGSKFFDVLGKLYSRMTATKYAGEAFRMVLIAIAAVKAAETVEKVAEAVTNLYKAFTKIPKLLGGISLLVVAVGLLVEDWMAFKNGEESVIGDLEKRWPAAFKVIKTAMDGLLYVWEGIVDAARALGIIQAAPPKKGSLAWYEQEKSKPHYQDSMSKEDWELWNSTKDLVESGKHPEQIAATNAMVATGASQSLPNVQAPNTSSWSFKDWIGSVFAGGSFGEMQQTAAMLHALNQDQKAKAAAGGTVVNVVGTKVEVKADTPERAAKAGESVRDALSARDMIRNYQPKGI